MRHVSGEGSVGRAQSTEQRWTVASWAFLLAALAFLLLPAAVNLLTLDIPTDGWQAIRRDSGMYRLERQVVDRNPQLRVGDLIVAIDGQPLGPSTMRPLPVDYVGQPELHYTVQRGAETLETAVQLGPIPHADRLRLFLSGFLAQSSITAIPYLSLLVALVAFALRPGNPAARYMLLVFAYYSGGSLAAGMALGDLYSGAMPAPLLFLDRVGVAGWGWVFFPSLTLLALSFPVVKWPLRRWPRGVPLLLYGLPLGLAVTAVCFDLTRSETAATAILAQAVFVSVLVAFLISLFGGLFHDFRTLRHPRQRAQLRWIALGLGVGWGVPMTVALTELLLGTLDPNSWASTLVWLTLLFPLCLSVAITRYRLFDIDVIIRRTLVYGLVIGLLAIGFFGAVVLLQRSFTLVTGQGSPAAIVLSTLAIAAAFDPVRRVVRRFVDRRFYRSRYDASRTLEHFSDVMRDAVSLEQVHDHLVDAVSESLRPAAITVWLREGLETAKADIARR